MKLHPRFFKVQEAELDFKATWIAFVSKHGLTYGEEISLLSQELSNISRYMVRVERHGERSDKKGDEA